MEIRFSRDEDLPEIISLLKKSLGESLLPKSEGYWLWKHVKNPFGASPVLLALEGKEIIGVRAFMQWRWKKGDQLFYAVRAVDTATSPAHQGRGVFSKLTKALLDFSKEQKFDFVFNTPNEKSKPGYLKMGWEVAGKLPIDIKLTNPVGMIYSAMAGVSFHETTLADNDVTQLLSHPGLEDLIVENSIVHGDVIITAHSRQSLRWRYADVPIVKYYAISSDNGGNRLEDLVLYRLKTSRFGLELRITDVLIRPEADIRRLRAKLSAEVKRHGAHFVTIASTAGIALINGGLSIKRVAIGPNVTVRKVCLQSLENHLQFNQWSPSTGDLELF